MPPQSSRSDRAQGAQRIVTLLASGTEIVCLLGLRDRLVGISHECDYPPDVRGLPVLTEARVDGTESPAEIDRRVRQHVSSGLSLYAIDNDRMRQLQPDLIITQDQCRVCAVSLEQVEAEVRGWLGSDVRIVSLNPVRLRETLDDIDRVALAAGVSEKGGEVRASLEARLDRLVEKTVPGRVKKPKVACLEWTDPPFLSGNWMPELVDISGGRSVGPAPGEHSPQVSWKDVADAEPDVLLILPCGFSLQRILGEAPAVLKRREVRGIPAARTGQIWALDGNAYFNRSGPRLVDSAEILGSVLHPELFGPPPSAAACRLRI
ncbi:MAG: cobalamin-binding protein [Acidobacteria bacterium]|nr:cobalamin-binding protein [Acidobacteriota bacterium]